MKRFLWFALAVVIFGLVLTAVCRGQPPQAPPLPVPPQAPPVEEVKPTAVKPTVPVGEKVYYGGRWWWRKADGWYWHTGSMWLWYYHQMPQTYTSPVYQQPFYSRSIPFYSAPAYCGPSG